MADGIETTLDHLVVAAATLAQGVEYVRDVLGVELSGGGAHEAQGTHNRLLRLGRDRYLEVIAIDPDGKPPSRPRWFELDTPRLQAALAERPRLLTWVARTTDIAAAAASAPAALGGIRPMSRGPLRWHITLTDDGSLPEGGLVPPLIQWDTDPHPASALPDAGCELLELAAVHPDPERVHRALQPLALDHWLRIARGSQSGLTARIRTPSGVKALAGL
jgi:hypothetical protein